MDKKKILMINISRSPIAMSLAEFENYEKRGSEYISSKAIIKFVKNCNVTQELVDWADIICSKYHCVSSLVSNSGKLSSKSPLSTVKGVLYGEQTLYIIHNYVSGITIEKKTVSKDELKKYSGFVFKNEEEAIKKAKELIKNQINSLNKQIHSLNKQLETLTKEKTLS